MDGTTSSTISRSKVLAQEYFSKPMHALFRSFDLAAYDLAKLDIAHPALDLGCGNGAFGSVFCRVMGLDGLDFGLDLNPKDVRQARRRGIYKTLFQSDARALPLKTATVRFILANGLLCCIHPGNDSALREVARILETGGQLVMTVPTPRFTAALVFTRLFESLKFRNLTRLYCRRVNRRNGIRESKDLEDWTKALERVGLIIEDHIYYFSATEASWWSVFAMRPFQFFAIFRYLPTFVQGIAVAFMERLIHFIPPPVNRTEKNCGFVLIIAKKV